MKRNHFLPELNKALLDFDLQGALALSDKIHEAEERGYETTPLEEKRWMQLTFKIEDAKQFSFSGGVYI